MPDINKYRVAVMILAVVVIALIIVLIAQNGGNVPTPQEIQQQLASTTATVQTSSSSQNGTTATGSTAKTVGTTKSVSSVGFTIHLVAPVAGDVWTIATQNTISWDHAAGVAGQIDLLNASTHALAGVIIPQLGPNQTSYTWNTRDILLTRTNPLKTNVTPGTYLIRIAFDGNGLSPITSGAITIVQ